MYKFVHLESIELNKHWTKVFYNIAKGNKTEYDSLRRTDFIEFWYLLDEFEAEIERQKLNNIKRK